MHEQHIHLIQIGQLTNRFWHDQQQQQQEQQQQIQQVNNNNVGLYRFPILFLILLLFKTEKIYNVL